jgi:hypothetical protein
VFTFAKKERKKGRGSERKRDKLREGEREIESE